MRVKGYLYKNGSCFTRNNDLAFQADRIEGVMLMNDMTLAQLKQSIRDRLKMGRCEEICNVTYRMPITMCPMRFGELNLCDDYSVGMMFECFRDNATKLIGLELLVQMLSTSIVEFDLNVSQVIDEGGSSMVVACTQALEHFTIEPTNINSAIFEASMFREAGPANVIAELNLWVYTNSGWFSPPQHPRFIVREIERVEAPSFCGYCVFVRDGSSFAVCCHVRRWRELRCEPPCAWTVRASPFASMGRASL
ncbi:uncharacterized protein G2W53_033609 [Senna tora]|uniref:Uncharacterized protein n=1 Tax=Senna tora TaxID=362788 RepID=A0A834SXV0_9FABA|nr:uncharacterized protein G2W53_033609 [Senna tora]